MKVVAASYSGVPRILRYHIWWRSGGIAKGSYQDSGEDVVGGGDQAKSAENSSG